MTVLSRLIASLTLALTASTTIAAEIYFPPADGTWETVDPASAGWDPTLLSEALDVAGSRDSSGVVVLYRGRIMAERYWRLDEDGPGYGNMFQGYDENGYPIEDVASAQKSVVAVLAGMAQQRGYLDIDDRVNDYLEAGWSRATPAQERAITIRHLLSMTSGLATDFSYDAAPGSRWLYNTPVYHRTMEVLMAATGLERNQLTVDWISRPLGMANTKWTPRPWADAAIAVGLSTTPRELARFGLMIQAGGRWHAQQIVTDTEFLADMLSPSQSLNPAYGLLWWVNGQAFRLGANARATRQDGPLIAAAPDDLVAMQGAADRKLYLVPSLDLVITRLGANGSRPGSSFNDAFWEILIKAAPAGAH